MNGGLRGRGLVTLVGISLGLAIAAPAWSERAIDCPLRDRPYSVDSPLLDILVKQEARLALETAIPGLLATIPSFLTNTRPPTFAAIVTP